MAPPGLQGRLTGRGGQILTADELSGGLVTFADVVVVGSGPCGVVAALTLAEKGHRVVLLEAGAKVEKKDLLTDAIGSFSRFFWDDGMRVMRGTSFTPTLQVRALGGGSVFNSAICMRPDLDTFERWEADHGVRLDGIATALDWAEAFFEVGPSVPKAFGRRNTLFREGCESLGWAVEPLRRMAPGCIGTGQCLTGCRVDGKSSADRRGVPEFLAAGGIVCTGVEVDRLLLRGGKAAGVEGHTTNGSAVRVMADRIVLAAGVMATPVLLQRSGVDARAVGANLQVHPSSFAMAVFDEDVMPWTGASQGMHCVEHLPRGIKLEDLWATPAVFASRFPLQGKAFSRYLEKTRKMGTWAAWITASASSGSVRAGPGGLVDYEYNLAPSDVARLQDGIVHLSELSFAAGAKEVLLGIQGFPPAIRPDDLDRLRQTRVSPRDLAIASNHVFGTMRMGTDSGRAACDHHGRVFGLEGVVVVDTSLFCDSPGANPMLLGMALARQNAQHMR